jgi:metal-responsive CopG/Arc/MetJ family transcriptional regulator
MRTLVDIPKEDLSLLTRLSEADGVSRAELVRRAVSAYLQPRRLARRADAFGLWGARAEDGVAYQRRMRDEWPD